MSEIIWGQVLFVLASLCSGMLLIACYDVLRLFRWLIPHGRLWLWLEDTLYWCLASVPIFYLFFSYNEGVIRWYGLLGILVGAILYETGISIPIRSWLGRYANRIRQWFRKWMKHVRKWCGIPIREVKKKIQKKRAAREGKKQVSETNIQKSKRKKTESKWQKT